jgi:ADP-ribose pyrophosphatase YjhB (NUDIX family)
MTIRHFTASAVVFDDEDRILLVHHNKIGLWLYPGGHVDPNESPAEAAVREVLEETGVHAAVLGEPTFAHAAVRSHAAPWTVIEMDVTDSRDGQHRHIDFVYVCRAAGGDLAAQQEEVDGVEWVPVADVAGLPTPVEMPELIAVAALWAKKAREPNGWA